MGVHVCNTSTGKQKHGNETFILGQPKLGMRPQFKNKHSPIFWLWSLVTKKASRCC